MDEAKVGNEFDYMKLLMKFNGKFSSLFNKREHKPPEFINPFIYYWNIAWYQWIKMILLTLTLLPIKILCFLVTFWLAYFVSFITLYKQTSEDAKKPFSGWRKNVSLPLFGALANISFFICGIMDIRVKGAPIANKEEAPVIVLAPHSAYLDSFFPTWMGMASVVGKTESARSWIGYLLRMTQPVLVSRDDPDSRKNCIEELCRRSHISRDEEDWPQMVIFPEGTCTNRTCLINFKTGAFTPGCATQPVVIRWSNFVDVFTWTWDGPSTIFLLWMLFAQLYVSVELEFLPVYYPNEYERSNPQLYADNVRKIMAKSLGIPISNHSYQDCRHITLAVKHGLPFSEVIVEFIRLHNALSIHEPEQLFEIFTKMFQKLHTITTGYELVRQLFDIDHNMDGVIYRLSNFYRKNYKQSLDTPIHALAYHLVAFCLPDHFLLMLKLFSTNQLKHNSILQVPLQIVYNLNEEEAKSVIEQATEMSNTDSNIDFLNSIVSVMQSIEGIFSVYNDYHEEFARSKKQQISDKEEDKCITDTGDFGNSVNEKVNLRQRHAYDTRDIHSASVPSCH